MNLDKNVTYKGRGPYVFLDRHPFLEDLFRSLRSYFEGDRFPSDALMENKIQEAGENPSNVYLEVGFKNLSHYSTAYKKKYGHSPKRTITI